MRPYGRIFTHMPFRNNLNMSSILVERLVSVDANSRLGGFLPAAPKFCGFGSRLPPQNAAYYTTTLRQKTNPRQKSSAGASAPRQGTSGALNHLSRVLERTARHERPYVASGKHGLQDAALASIGDHHVSAGLGRYANRLELRVHSAL